MPRIDIGMAYDYLIVLFCDGYPVIYTKCNLCINQSRMRKEVYGNRGAHTNEWITLRWGGPCLWSKYYTGKATIILYVKFWRLFLVTGSCLWYNGEVRKDEIL